MASIIAGDNLVVVSTGNSALVWTADTDRGVKTLEQPRTLETSNGTAPSEFVVPASRAHRKGETNSEHEERHMACVAVSSCGGWLALASSRGQKQLGLWRTSNWTMESARPMARAASCVRFTPSGSAIIVADKPGDVYMYSVKEPTREKQWLLGHLSMLLDFLITPDERYIITCDRDEKIRVSCFPNAYNIHSFCLGHELFVSSLTLLPHSPATLVSTSGDGTVRLWNYSEGRSLHTVDVEKIIGESVNTDSPVPVKSCVGLPIDASSSLLCICVAGLTRYITVRVSETGGAWESSVLQQLELGAELWALTSSSAGVLALSRSQPRPLTVWRWDQPSTSLAEDTEHPCVQEFSKCWDSLESCFSNPPIPTLLYRRKHLEPSADAASEKPGGKIQKV